MLAIFLFAASQQPYTVAKLAVHFQLKGSLAIVTSHLGTLPIGVGWYIALETGSGYRRVYDLSALEGEVKLNSASDALEFVRLRTSPCTRDMMHWQLLELVPSDSTHDLPTYGLSSYAVEQADPSRYRPPYMGVMPHDQFYALGLQKPVVKPEGSGWLIRRWVLRDPWGWAASWEAQFVAELVGRKGEYRFEVLKRRKPEDWPAVRFRREWQNDR